MRGSAVLFTSAMLLLAAPAITQAQTEADQVNFVAQGVDIEARRENNSEERADAAKKCDLVKYGLRVSELAKLLSESERLLDTNWLTGFDYTWARALNDRVRRDYTNALIELARLEEECRKKAPGAGGDTGVAPPTPPTEPTQPAVPPPDGFDTLWAQAMAAFNANYSSAANCDVAGMRAQQSKLEIYTRDARDRASKLRRRAARSNNPERKKEADAATAYEKAIESLWQQALATPPLNCPQTGLQIPPDAPAGANPPPPVPPGAIPPPPPVYRAPAPPAAPPAATPPPVPPPGGSQDCPVPGTPGGSAPGKTPPEHGMRFTPPDDNSQRLLAAQNRARAEAGVPPLIWDRELAAGAAAYAMQMSTVGRVHAPRAGRKCVRENLLQSLRGGRSPEEMIAVWTSEKRNFVPGIFPDVSRTGNWANVGHYTQVIWRNTTYVGCATSSDTRYDWLVCRYSPPGNQDGQPVL